KGRGRALLIGQGLTGDPRVRSCGVRGVRHLTAGRERMDRVLVRTTRWLQKTVRCLFVANLGHVSGAGRTIRDIRSSAMRSWSRPQCAPQCLTLAARLSNPKRELPATMRTVTQL